MTSGGGDPLAAAAESPSDSERLLFGGELTYDHGWGAHDGARLKPGLRAMAGSLPRQVAVAVRRAVPSGGLALPEDTEQISFEKVTFTYPGADEPSLHEVDLVIPRGRTVALVGRNGSGKSTLVRLLSGVRLPDSGRVLWGGVSTAEADRAQVFDRVARVAQDFFLRPFTARVNIGIGRSRAARDDRTIEAAAAYAGADEVIEGLPRGLDSLLARGCKGGQEISGGQWQKIGLARARHRDGTVLIVDEPTSALDPAAEQRVFDQIHRLSGSGRTTVLITHRLHSVRHAALVYVLDEGRVVEHGTFAELMEPATGAGAFREMYEPQARQFLNPSVPAQPAPRGGEAGRCRRRGAGAVMRMPRPGGPFTSAAGDHGRRRPGVPAEAVSLRAGTVRDVDRPVLLARRPGGGA